MSNAKDAPSKVEEPAPMQGGGLPTGRAMQAVKGAQALEAPISVTHSRNDRMLAASPYFASLAGLWLIVPAVLYVWEGRESRFIAFHAVQSLLLQVALIPVAFVGVGLAAALSILVSSSSGPPVIADHANGCGDGSSSRPARHASRSLPPRAHRRRPASVTCTRSTTSPPRARTTSWSAAAPHEARTGAPRSA